MKKVLSILISVMMVAGLFVALVPTASAETVAATTDMPETGLLVYNEDFEDESLNGLTDHDLTLALGWIQDQDIVDDPNTTWSEASIRGIDNAGTAEIVSDEKTGNHSVYLTFGTGGDGYGWAWQMVENDRLAGGDFIIEWTQTLSADTSASFGVGFRNGVAWNGGGLTGYDTSEIFTWGTNFKFATNKQANTQIMYGKANQGSYNGPTISTWLNQHGIDYTGYTSNQTIPYTFTYRTVVSSTNGIHNYIWLDTTTASNIAEDGWYYYCGTDATGTAAVVAHADQITPALNMLLRNSVKATIDDISVWTIADENQPTVEMLGYQTAANGSNLDARLVAKVGNLAETDVVAQVRYEICINEEFWTDVWLENAYKEITASYGAEAITAEADELLTALHVTGCPAGTTFSITPYVTFKDGAQLIGDTFDCTISA